MKKLITTLLFLFILIIPQNIFATSREYYIDNLDIEAKILQNGDVEVNEILQYRFSGQFNGIFRNLISYGSDGYIINDVSIIDESGNTIKATEGYNEENNTYEINDLGGETQIKLFTKSSDETKSINIKYTIKEAAKKYENFSELYWNFYTVENIDSVKSGTLKISLKNDNFNKDSFYYELFGDGKIDSNYTEDLVEVNFKDLTSLIGIKLQFQKDYLNMVDEIPIDIDENNNGDYSSYEKCDISENNNSSIFIILGILICGGVGAWFINKSKFENELAKYREEYIFTNNEFLIDPPSDLPPALVNLLINEKYVNESMLNPTLFYLANKGYYKLEEKTIILDKKGKKTNKEDLVFTRVNLNTNLEFEHLDYVLKWFEKYESEGSFTLQEIKKVVKSENKAKEFVEKLSKWQKIVIQDAENRGFYTEIRNKKVLENSWYNEKLKWLNYKEYLKKIGNTHIVKIDDRIGDNLIYAYALEITNKEFKNLIDTIKIDTKMNNYDLYSNNHWLYDNYFYYTTLFNVINGTAHNAANPPNNSSSDFGGISSGGGFTGGGGGDSGAF